MGERLDSWKDIAAYLGRDLRTVQRWAGGRGLPVHRRPGGGEKPPVFALKSELDDWIRAGGRQAHEGPASVAVLPFANLAGAAGQRFGDGLADDIINELVRVPGLRVTARTSSFAFRDTGHDVRQIGARLGVGWLVEGSVRRSGRRVRVSAQLVGTRDGFHIWSDTYDRELTDVFAIQADIARSIALALKVKLAPEPPARRPTEDVLAYDLCVRGRTVGLDYTPSAVAEAWRCYDAAIARDPLFARPWLGLADLLFQSVQFGLSTSADDACLARRALERALELDNLSGDAHALSGVLLGLIDYDWPAAEAAFRRARQLSPGSSGILLQHAWFHLVPQDACGRGAGGSGTGRWPRPALAVRPGQIRARPDCRPPVPRGPSMNVGRRSGSPRGSGGCAGSTRPRWRWTAGSRKARERPARSSTAAPASRS